MGVGRPSFFSCTEKSVVVKGCISPRRLSPESFLDECSGLEVTGSNSDPYELGPCLCPWPSRDPDAQDRQKVPRARGPHPGPEDLQRQFVLWVRAQDPGRQCPPDDLGQMVNPLRAEFPPPPSGRKREDRGSSFFFLEKLLVIFFFLSPAIPSGAMKRAVSLKTGWREWGGREGARGVPAQCFCLCANPRKCGSRGVRAGGAVRPRAWWRWAGKPGASCESPPSDLSGCSDSRFKNLRKVGGRCRIACSHSSQVARQSYLFIFRWYKKSKSPFTAIDPYSYLMPVVLVDSSLVLFLEASRDSEGPRKVWGLEPS